MKKRKIIVHKFIYTLFSLALALLSSTTLFTQPTNKRIYQTETGLLKGFKQARFPHIFRSDEQLHQKNQSRLTNTSDSLNVRLVGRWANGPCDAVAVVGSIAYFGNGAYLEIVDFSTPTIPTELGKVLLPEPIYDVAVI